MSKLSKLEQLRKEGKLSGRDLKEYKRLKAKAQTEAGHLKNRPYTYDEYLKDYKVRADYKLNAKMTKGEFEHQLKDAKKVGESDADIRQHMRENMFETSLKQAEAARTNLSKHLKDWEADTSFTTKNEEKFRKEVLARAKELEIKDLSVADMRKANGKLQLFMDDVAALAKANNIAVWTDMIFGS